MHIEKINSGYIARQTESVFVFNFETVLSNGEAYVLHVNVYKNNGYISIPHWSDPNLGDMILSFWNNNKKAILSN